MEMHTLHLIPHPMQYSLLTYLEHTEGRSPLSTPVTIVGTQSPSPREEPCPQTEHKKVRHNPYITEREGK